MIFKNKPAHIPGSWSTSTSGGKRGSHIRCRNGCVLLVDSITLSREGSNEFKMFRSWSTTSKRRQWCSHHTWRHK